MKKLLVRCWPTGWRTTGTASAPSSSVCAAVRRRSLIAAIAPAAISPFEAIALTSGGRLPKVAVSPLHPLPGASNAPALLPGRSHRHHGLPVRGRRSQTHRGECQVERRLVAQSTEPEDSAPALRPVQPHGQGVRLRRGVREPRPARRHQGPACLDDDIAGVVARGLRPLWAVLHPHGVAQRRHVPHRRRSRRLGHWVTAICAPQQLAGQREPRQGAPFALAREAEVRPETLLGRPDDPRR